MLLYTCKECGTEFRTHEKHRKFCSIDCYTNNLAINSTMVNTNCLVCHHNISVKRSKYIKNFNNFCSVECKNSSVGRKL